MLEISPGSRKKRVQSHNLSSSPQTPSFATHNSLKIHGHKLLRAVTALVVADADADGAAACGAVYELHSSASD